MTIISQDDPIIVFIKFTRGKLGSTKLQKQSTAPEKKTVRIIVLLCCLGLTQPLIYFIPAAANNSKRNFAASIPSRIVVQDNEDSGEDEDYNPDDATKLSTLDSSEEVYEDEEVCTNQKVFTDQPAYCDEEVSVAGHYSVDLEVDSEKEEELISDFNKMTVSTFKASSFKTEYPFLVYDYIDTRQKKVCLDFLVYSMDREKFLCKFNKSGSQVLIYTRIPNIFTARSRIMDADSKLQVNTSKVVAFDALDAKVEATLEADEEEYESFGPPQVVKLPFICDTKIPIDHEMQAFESDWTITDEDDGDMQFTMILSIELESIEKPTRAKERKMMKVFKSPRPRKMSGL